MKMAKANRADMDAALDICGALESLAQGCLPNGMTDQDDETSERYDYRKHAAEVVEHLLEIASKGSLFRVCFGMTVVLDPRNEVVDPAADTLEIHPKHEQALVRATRYEKLRRLNAHQFAELFRKNIETGSPCDQPAVAKEEMML